MAERVSLSQLENRIFEAKVPLDKTIYVNKFPFWTCKKFGAKAVETNFEIDEPTLSFETLKTYIEENSAPNGKTPWQITLQDYQAKDEDMPLYKCKTSNNRIKTIELLYTHEADKKVEQSLNTNQDNRYWQNKCDTLEKKIDDLKEQNSNLKEQLYQAKITIEQYQNEEFDEVEETDTIAGLPKELVQNAVMGILGLTQKQNSSQPINGIEVEGVENKTEKLKNILQRIKAVDRNYVENLEVLAKFMEQQPQQYFSFLPTMKGLTK